MAILELTQVYHGIKTYVNTNYIVSITPNDQQQTWIATADGSRCLVVESAESIWKTMCHLGHPDEWVNSWSPTNELV